MVDKNFDGDYLDCVLDTAVRAVNETLRVVGGPPQLHLDRPPHDRRRIRGGMGFINLLGAMYLQMNWLMLAVAEVNRCRYCGRTISYASPRPGGRKRRNDKKFCNKSCRQSYAYHNQDR